MRYRLVSDHIEDLDDGSSVEPGGFVDLDEEQLRGTHTEELVAAGKLIPAEEEKKKQDQAQQEASLAKRRVTGRERREGDTDGTQEGEEA